MDEILAIGTIECLILKNLYPSLSWIACPHSWDATATEAIEVLW